MQAKKTCDIPVPLPSPIGYVWSPGARKPPPGFVRRPNFGYVRWMPKPGKYDLRAMNVAHGVGRPPGRTA